MTVINHKSISGITSITAPAGSDNLFTVHTNDTTERFRIDASGHQNISGIITASNFKTGTTNVHNVGVEAAGINVLGADTPIGTGATIYNSGAAVFTGVVTATSFSGSTGTFTGDVTVNGDELFIADSIKHIGDTDTLISFPSNDTINFRTAGDERLRIGSTGKLTFDYDGSTENNLADIDFRTNNGLHIRGFDGNSNDVKLYIGGAVGNQRKIAIIHDPVGGYCRGDLHFCLENSADLSDVDVTDSKMVIKADGRVGINTTVPITAHLLSLDGPSNYQAGIFYKQAGVNQYRFMCEGGTGSVYYDTFVDGGDHIFRTNAQATGGTEVFRITEEGKLGLGHHSTSQIDNGKELSIRPANGGGIRLIRPGDTIASPNTHLDITTTTAGSVFPSGEAYTVKYKTYNSDQIFETYAGGGTGGNISFRTNTSDSSNETLRIASNGNVRIGPAGAPNLAVGGGLEIERAGAATIRIEDTSSGSGFEIQNTGGVIKQRMYNNQPWTIEYGGGEKLRITSAGHVNIGGVSPSSSALCVKMATNKHIGFSPGQSEVGNVPALVAFQDNGSLAEMGFRGTDLRFATGSAERLRINSSGKVRVGSGSATYNFEVQNSGNIEFLLGSTNAGGASIIFDGDANGDGSGGDYAQIFHDTSGDMNYRARGGSGASNHIFLTGTTERLRIDASGHLHTGYTSNFGGDHINILANDGGGISIAQNNVGNASSGTTLGTLSFQGYHSGGATFSSAEAKISAITEEAHTGSTAATGLRFYTKQSGTGPGSSPSERLRIHHNGVLSQPFGPCQINGSAAAALVNITGRQHQANNTHLQTDYKQGLSVGWYTIATCNSGRASGRIGIRETYSSRHQACVFYAAHHYGGSSNQNCINTIFSSGRHSGNPIGAIRIKAYGTYDGAMLQVYLRDSGGGVQAFMLGDNMQDQGWIMKNWIADGTDPGGLGNYTNIQNNFASPSSYSDMNEIQAGGASFGGRVIPGKDDQWTLGRPSYRWADVYSMNSSNQTSDESLKQDIATLTTAEMNAAKRLSALFKTYRWKDAVVEKGNEKARTHTGIIAQQVKSAMEAESLDPTKYAFYCVDEWYEDSQGTKLPLETATREGDSVEEGTNAELGGSIVVPTGFNKVTRYSVRYVELLAFISAYNEQRFTSIESRLTALESS